MINYLLACSSKSSPFFLRSGLIIALFHLLGKVPVCNDLLMIRVLNNGTKNIFKYFGWNHI